MAYNPIDTAILASALEGAGFKATQVGNEKVYSRANHNLLGLVVKVYTSGANGAEKVKAKGQDAIRVVLVYTNGNGQTFGVTKAQRVFRTGSDSAIVGRMLSRMREMYGVANEMAKSPRCPTCGAPCWLDSGKCVAHRSHKGKAAKAKVVKAQPANLPMEQLEAEMHAMAVKAEGEQEAAAMQAKMNLIAAGLK